MALALPFIVKIFVWDPRSCERCHAPLPEKRKCTTLVLPSKLSVSQLVSEKMEMEISYVFCTDCLFLGDQTLISPYFL